VVNADDRSADFFAASTKHQTYRFSTRGAKADLSISLSKNGAFGNWYEVFICSTGETLALRDRLPGAFNAGNVLAALITVSNLLSMEIRELASLIPLLKPVRGRMTVINRGQPFEVLVDYAHTPSSFEAVLPPLSERIKSKEDTAKPGARLICLFGSAGERDIHKRRIQGEIAARYSDIVILSDEDPRSENPMAILEEIAQGCLAASGCYAAEGREVMKLNENLFLIPDRRKAIRKAYSLAKEGDLVVLLGKGHENSIIYADGSIPWDEITEAEKALEESGFR
jgi:UDP-N-acetylmuramoyl-L-alanyl-D-glutamate--2,6-diaminopimelate ligase